MITEAIPMSKFRILLVDDEDDFRETLRDRLQMRGYTVEAAPAGEKGLEIFKQNDFDVVVLDIRMPGMDGLEAMGRILEENNEIPVVINTAYSAYKDSFLSWCAEAYVTKSSDLTHLKETVRKILEEEEKTVQPL
jgi:CheY-like chemotaxis protein